MYFGAQYYRPPFPYSCDWERDFKNMQELGFNIVKLWAVWNRIEKVPGVFDFAELDELVELAKKYNLKVVINTIPEGAPYWTLAGNEDGLYQTCKGEKVNYGGPPNIPSAGWPGLCFDSPEGSRLATNFIEKTAEHFADNNNVIIIDVWNEPHLEPMFDYREDILCYCSHSCKKFVEWLKLKYVTLDKLNEKWYRNYSNWNEVTPPLRFGTYADMMDWRIFWLYNLRDWLKIRVEAARRGAPRKKIQTHVAYSATLGNKIKGGLANELGDEFLLAPEVDIFGLSSFPKWLMGKEHIITHLAHNEVVAEGSRSKPYYQMELQGGAGKAGLLGSEVPNERDVRLWNWNTIAAGGKGVVYWQYAPEPSGLEAPGFGLTGFEGENTERSLEASKCAKGLNYDILDRAHRVHATNAIYLSRHSQVLCYCGGRQEELYAGSLFGIYKAAYRSSLPIRFCHEDYLEDLKTDGIKNLFLPMTLALSEREISAFKEFVEAGGTIITEACPGMFNEEALLDTKSRLLKELFALQHIDLQASSDWGEITAKWLDSRECFKGTHYRQIVRPLDNSVKVLAEFNDGKPAVTERSYGKGKAIWIGTFSSFYYHQTGDAAARNLFTRFMDKGGYNIVSKVTVNQPIHEDQTFAPVIRLHETDEEYILILVNHSFVDVQISIEFNSPQKIVSKDYKNAMLTVQLKQSDGMLLNWKK
jgi:beta-galactosidase GanA